MMMNIFKRGERHMLRLAIGRVLLWLILPAAEEKWGRDAATCRLADGPLLHYHPDPVVFPEFRSAREVLRAAD
jgi:hypothetical protein